MWSGLGFDVELRLYTQIPFLTGLHVYMFAFLQSLLVGRSIQVITIIPNGSFQHLKIRAASRPCLFFLLLL